MARASHRSTTYYIFPDPGISVESDMVKRNMILFPGGYFDADLNIRFFLTDHQGNNTYVVSPGGSRMQQIDYYPYGEPHRRPISKPTLGNSDINTYLYSGKEFLNTAGADEYDFHARRYTPSLPFFTTPDSYSGNTPDISPYAYCAGNPIMHIDPTGKEYYVYINNDNKTINIQATYYAFASDISTLNKGIDFWNNLSGKYSLGDYTINFELKSEEAYNYNREEKFTLLTSYTNTISEPTNIFKTDEIHNSEVNGRTQNGRWIITKKYPKTSTIAHEIGHTIGLIHSYSGLMTAEEKSHLRSNTIYPYQLDMIIKHAVNNEFLMDDDDYSLAGKGKSNIDFEEFSNIFKDSKVKLKR